MLTPTVRAAAAKFATDQLGTPHIKALEGAYLTGYARGYQAQGERRQFPLAGQRALLRTLGPYVAEGIDIYHPATGQYGRLLGLPAVYGHEPYPVADVEMYVGAEARADGCGDLIEHSPDKILPVLYSFEDLGKQADSFRSDAAAHAAMMQLAAALQGGAVTEIVEAHYSEGNGRLRIWLQYEDEEGDYCDAYLWNDGSATDANEEALQMSDWLRQHHFAVGLTPNEYHRKQVAARPFEYLTMGEPLPPVTPCPSGRNDCPSGCPKCPAEMEVHHG